jgi:putative SOS response-associated peptidase YedK
MCSRYSLTSPPEAVRAYFNYKNEAEFPARYNIAPSQPVAVVRIDARGDRELALVRWGLIPAWVKDPKAFTTLINARSESIVDKPSFRGAMRYRRCLVPADGFYEWSDGQQKQPYLIRPKTGGPMALAGLWEHWLGADGSEIETMAIVTTAANRAMRHLHERMPVILAPEQFALWLDVKRFSPQDAALFLRPAPDSLLEAFPVSKAVGNPRNEGAELWRPLQTQARLI